ncbi:hypothetical protein HMPREF0239_00031 [Clostridium sp. ATCC BAA-442]|nr:hypothetical protein HMPREF0239_00031 [Clostridium sp. ATCC BAA-442]
MFRFQTHRNLVPFRRQEIYCFLYWLKYYLDTQVHFIYFFCYKCYILIGSRKIDPLFI